MSGKAAALHAPYSRFALPVLALGATLALVLGVLVGSTPIPLERLGSALLGTDDHDWVRTVLLEVRLPRVCVGFLVGAALSLAGATLQALFRNPLADPAVLGVSASAALGAQLVLFLGAASTPWVLPLAACVAAGAATLTLLGLLGRLAHTSVELVILGGVALGQVAVAGSALLLSLSLADFTVARQLLQWMLGTLDGRTWMHAAWAAAPVLLCGALLLERARLLDALGLGEPTAASLGVDVARLRRELVVAASLLSGVAVAVGGVITFVGLLVPHVMRPWVGPGHRRLLPACLFAGGGFVILADVVARTAIRPEELELGVVTAGLGAPWFLLLLARRFQEVRP